MRATCGCNDRQGVSARRWINPQSPPRSRGSVHRHHRRVDRWSSPRRARRDSGGRTVTFAGFLVAGNALSESHAHFLASDRDSSTFHVKHRWDIRRAARRSRTLRCALALHLADERILHTGLCRGSAHQSVPGAPKRCCTRDRNWMPHMYILECSNRSLYVGSARNLEHRLAQHGEGEDRRTRAHVCPSPAVLRAVRPC
ncbi:GIY-YIG nuclease family protein [Microbacterium sp. HJ5]